MTRLVVDASVAIKWAAPEEHSTEAESLLHAGYELIAPDLIAIEVASAAAKRVTGSGISVAEAHELLELALGPLELVRSLELVSETVDMALARGIWVYDALYLALALTERCRFITADRRLYNALAPALPRTMRWVADLPEPA